MAIPLRSVSAIPPTGLLDNHGLFDICGGRQSAATTALSFSTYTECFMSQPWSLAQSKKLPVNSMTKTGECSAGLDRIHPFCVYIVNPLI
jgi:hypothetical protein